MNIDDGYMGAIVEVYTGAVVGILVSILEEAFLAYTRATTVNCLLWPALSYVGWQQDAAEVEDGLVRCGPSVASRMLAKMRRKQRLHEGNDGQLFTLVV